MKTPLSALALFLPYALAGCTVGPITCYADDGKRILNAASYAGKPTTLEWCAQYCHDHNMTLAGVENHAECYCGTAVRPDAKKADTSKCNEPCSANDKEKCGGYWHLGVYAVTCSGTPVPEPKGPPRLVNPCANKTSPFASQPWCDAQPRWGF